MMIFIYQISPHLLLNSTTYPEPLIVTRIRGKQS